MVYLRTASGTFISSSSIVRLADRDGERVAVRSDGEEVTLASYFAAPGRIERDLPQLTTAHQSEACVAEACCVGGICVVMTAGDGVVAA